ncbi:MAG: sensor histidine kinase [Roseinatronobacter sp.]
MPRLHNRLGARLATLLTLALVPLGGIAVYAEYEIWASHRAAVENEMLARTVDAVTGSRALLESTLRSARAIMPDMLEIQATGQDPEACSAYLQRYIAGTGFYDLAVFTDPEGRLVCSSSSTPVTILTADDLDSAPGDGTAPFFTFRDPEAAHYPAAVVSHTPVQDAEHTYGMLSIAIGPSRLNLIAPARGRDGPAKIPFIANHRGNTLTRSGQDAFEDLLPDADTISELIARAPGITSGRARNGEERIFSAAVLVPDQLYALASWDPDQRDLAEGLPFWRLTFPVLMWMASVAVVMLAVHYLVARHLKNINRKLRSFALGNRETFARLPADAPAELREIDGTFAKMALLIQRDEAEREATLREKTALLMEVNHRVKNNLQLIASILNLQGRRVSDPSARAILQGVQGRVRALATIHRTLYEQEQLSATEATVFFKTILRETLALATSDAQKLDVVTDFQPVRLAPDRVIPVALIFAEALTNALKHLSSMPAGQPARLRISYHQQGDTAILSVRNSIVPIPDRSPSDIDVDMAAPRRLPSGLGQELMSAFALQIDARLEMGPDPMQAAPTQAESPALGASATDLSATGPSAAAAQERFWHVSLHIPLPAPDISTDTAAPAAAVGRVL